MPSVRRIRPWVQKPPLSARIAGGHPLAQNLQIFYGLREHAGPNTTDALSRLKVSLNSGTPWLPSQGLNCNGNGYGGTVALPAPLQLTYPLTLAAGFYSYGAASFSPVGLFGLFANSTSSRYFSLETNGSDQVQIAYNGTTSSVTTQTIGTGYHVPVD